MTTPLSLEARQLRLTALRDLIDSGGGKLKLYTGTAVPATPDTAATDTLLGTIALAVPSGAIGAASGTATLTLTTPQATNASNTGIVGWVRFCKGSGAGVMDLPVVKSPATGPVVLSDTQVYAGGEIQLLSCLITE